MAGLEGARTRALTHTTYVDLQATLEVLSNLLGPPFEPAQPLQPIASSSKSVLPPAPAWTSLTRTTGMINFAGGYRRSASGGTLAQDIAESKVEVWMDVGEEVTESLSAAVQKAMDERVSLSRIGCSGYTKVPLLARTNTTAVRPFPGSPLPSR